MASPIFFLQRTYGLKGLGSQCDFGKVSTKRPSIAERLMN
jgi:hypothetical protein